jgi:hypothetical protein
MAIAAGITLVGAAAPMKERVVRIDTALPMTVAAVAGRLRIDPGAPGRPVLAPDYAGRVGLKGGGMMGIGVTYLIGRERVVGRTEVAAVTVDGGKPHRQRVIWAPRAFAAGVEGVMGPGGLDDPVVRFVLRPAVAGERTVAIPVAPAGGLFGNWSAMSGQVDVGGQPLRIRFAPYLAMSVATAAAAAQLAEGLGGRLDDTTGTAEIAFGLTRPVRGMVLARPLARPLAIGPLSLGRVAVRTADVGSIAGLPTTADAPADPDEIVVVARGKRAPGSMTLGADYLRRCSSIVFDKPRREIRLTCG